MSFLIQFMWGIIGTALVMYGRKAEELPPIVIGILLMALSYFCGALMLSIIGIILLTLWWWYDKSQ